MKKPVFHRDFSVVCLAIVLKLVETVFTSALPYIFGHYDWIDLICLVSSK